MPSRFETIFNHVNEGILIADSTGIIILANPKCHSMFGYASDQLEGVSIEDLIPSEFREKHVKYRSGYMEHPVKRSMGSNLSLYAVKLNTERFPVEVSLSYYQSDQGMYVIAFIIDISERFEQQERIVRINDELKSLNESLERKVGERTLVLKEALTQLEKSRDELKGALEKEKELNELKSGFISMASHEFRTPLSTILSSASLIQKYPLTEEQDKREKHIQRIKNAVTGLTEILNDFLSIGKLEEGKLNVYLVELDCCQLVEEVISEMQPICKPGQEFVYTHEGPCLLNTDKQIFRNVLINLFSNAIKFSPESSFVNVHSKWMDDEFVLSIKDCGIGISDEDQRHLFERFYRSKSVQHIQGTGLGLNIVARYMDLMNGRIECESQLNKGTSFFLHFPQSKDTKS
jgi:PAS domain S-box-containing protein